MLREPGWARRNQAFGAKDQAFRQTTFARSDIREFTALSERLDPGDIAEFLASFRCRATRAIEAHDGIVDKFVGDDVMGVFGVPAATSKDAANALAAGRALQAEIAAWNESVNPPDAGRFPSGSAFTTARCSQASSTVDSGWNSQLSAMPSTQLNASKN